MKISRLNVYASIKSGKNAEKCTQKVFWNREKKDKRKTCNLMLFLDFTYESMCRGKIYIILQFKKSNNFISYRLTLKSSFSFKLDLQLKKKKLKIAVEESSRKQSKETLCSSKKIHTATSAKRMNTLGLK